MPVNGACGKPSPERKDVPEKSASLRSLTRNALKAQRFNNALTQGFSVTQRLGVAIALLAVVGTVAPTLIRFVRNAALGKPKSQADNPDPGILSELASKLGPFVATPVRGALALGGVALASGLVYVAISQVWPRIPSYKQAFACVRKNNGNGRSSSDSVSTQANQWKTDALMALQLVRLALKFDELRTDQTKKLVVSYRERRTGSAKQIGHVAAQNLLCVGEPPVTGKQTSLDFLCNLYTKKKISPILWSVKAN